jgi:hypothetical protein
VEESNSEDERNMKAMLKSELAREAGVSMRTFRRWCKPFRKELIQMGWRPEMKLLPPKIVAFLADKLCIIVPNEA